MNFFTKRKSTPTVLFLSLFRSLSISLSGVFWKLFSLRVFFKFKPLIVEMNSEIKRCDGGSGETKQQGSIADLPQLRPYRVNFVIHTNYRGFQRKTMYVPFPFATHFFLGAISGQVLGKSVLHSRVRCSITLSLTGYDGVLTQQNQYSLSSKVSSSGISSFSLSAAVHGCVHFQIYCMNPWISLSFVFWRFYLIVCFAIAFYSLPSFLSLSIDFD